MIKTVGLKSIKTKCILFFWNNAEICLTPPPPVFKVVAEYTILFSVNKSNDNFFFCIAVFSFLIPF